MPPSRPLSARSVLLSILLGSHPATASAAELVAIGEHVGVPGSTMRVALSRALAAGDLVRDGATYRLAERHAARQRHQDEAVGDAAQQWDGTWEMAVVVNTGRPAAERAALRSLLAAHRLGEVREGVWARPANLQRPRTYADHPDLSVLAAEPTGARGLQGSADLVARAWDLDAWARNGRALAHELEQTSEPRGRLEVAAALVRHLADDPLLPSLLLPADWPGPWLRAEYARYAEELSAARRATSRSTSTPAVE